MAAEHFVSGAAERAPTSPAAIIGVSTTFAVLSTSVLLARIYTRLRVHHQLWWDDWTMVVGTAGTLGMCALNLVLMRHGGGLAIDDVPESELRIYTKIFNINQMVARVSILFVKLSILLLYIRIFFPVGVDRKGTFWWLIQGVIWMNVIYTVSLVLALALQCVPYGLPWGSSCTNQWLVIIFASIVNIVSDFAILFVPVASVWKLQMSKSRKWAVVSLFAFGTIAPLASIARLIYQIATVDSKDKTVVYLVAGILATAEQVVGIIVGSLPATSSWAVRRLGKLKAGRNALRAASQRLRRDCGTSPGSRDRKQQHRHAGGRDPYEATNATVWTSQELLCSSLENTDGSDYGPRD
ncbi:uncharacterized protein PG986_014044 [Apiospora aurea]|uniref:Rhodopsin domain-containing protein n=1 Tax=Apiospora aurea TaxID=335848 RepID=A0ABR1PRW1_9PEZI